MALGGRRHLAAQHHILRTQKSRCTCAVAKAARRGSARRLFTEMETLVEERKSRGEPVTLHFDFPNVGESDSSRVASAPAVDHQSTPPANSAAAPSSNGLPPSHADSTSSSPEPSSSAPQLHTPQTQHQRPHGGEAEHEGDEQQEGNGAGSSGMQQSLPLASQQGEQAAARWSSGRSGGSSTVDADHPPPPSPPTDPPAYPPADPTTPPSTSSRYIRPPRPVNLIRVDRTVILTMDAFTEASHASAAIRSALKSNSPLEVHVAGEAQLEAAVALLVAVDAQLRKLGMRVVMQPLVQGGAGALGETRLRLVVARVKGLTVQGTSDLKVYHPVNQDSFGELLDSKMVIQGGQRPPPCGVEVGGGAAALGGVMRGLVVARQRVKKRRGDISAAMEMVEVAGQQKGVLRLLCMRCPADSPQLLSWYSQPVA